VPDQLKSGVVIANRYEPGIQRTYDEWSQHQPRNRGDAANIEADH